MTNPARSKVAQELRVGDRVLVDGKRATFIGISDGKELYDFALEPGEGVDWSNGAVYVDLDDLDQRVRRESWDDAPEPDWLKEAEDFLRWNTLRQSRWHPDADLGNREVLKRAVRIIEGLVRRSKA